MKNLYLITGPAGVGKSTVSRRIAEKFDKSALVEGDEIYHQVVGGYSPAWQEGNHLELFWEVAFNTIETYLENGYDVVFNYIIDPDDLEMIRARFEDYNIKFVVLIVTEQIILERDSQRPVAWQMKDRCIVLLNNFKNMTFDKDYFLDTSSLSIDETVKVIEESDKFNVC